MYTTEARSISGVKAALMVFECLRMALLTFALYRFSCLNILTWNPALGSK